MAPAGTTGSRTGYNQGTKPSWWDDNQDVAFFEGESTQFSTHNQFYVGDFNGDGKADLFVYNYQDWSTQYLGRMISEGTTLAADWVADWVGEWNLGAVDQFAPCDA